MKRKLWFWNLLMLGALVWCGMHIRQTWQQSREREQALLARSLPALAVTQPGVAPTVPPVTPALYFDVAQKLLFSKDRNPNVIIDPPPPPPAPPPPPPWPPMPTVFGYMDFAGTPTVFMMEKQGMPQKRYHKGDAVGEMTIVDLDRNTITFEFDKRQEKKKYEELMARGPAVVEQPAAPAPPSAAPAGGSLTSAANGGVDQNKGNAMQQQNANVKPGPSAIQTSESTRACTGDTLPAGTVQDGYKKVVTQTPFGNRCEWQAVK